MPTGTGTSPLAGIESFVHTTCPVCGQLALRSESITFLVQVNGRLRDHTEVRFDATEDEIKQQALASGRVQRFIADNKIQRIIYVPGRLVNVVTG